MGEIVGNVENVERGRLRWCDADVKADQIHVPSTDQEVASEVNYRLTESCSILVILSSSLSRGSSASD